MKKIAKIPRVTTVEVRPPYGLHLTFDDGLTRVTSISPTSSGVQCSSR